MSNCIVCDNKLTLSATIKCEYCEFIACRACCRRWVLSESIPKCMGEGCGREWTREYIVEKLKKTWVAKDYKEHRENILYDQERALLPATQEVANARKERDKIVRKIEDIDEQIYNLKRIKEDYNNQVRILTRRGNNMESMPQEERRTFVKKCPIEDCPGYLSSQWKCGTCNIWACPECHVAKGENRDSEHTCHPDTLATARLLAQDTKACPKCHIDIYKIDGCNQMWCVKCHTAFDWRTLRIEEGNVHNPHYFQYLRETNNGNVPRNPADNPCGAGNVPQLLNARLLENVSYIFDYRNKPQTKERLEKLYNNLLRIVRNVVHLIHIEMPTVAVNYANRNLELRIRYLNRDITEQEFKIQLQRSEKRFDKKRALFQIFELVANTISDLVMSYIRKCIELHRKFISDDDRLLKPELQKEADELINELQHGHMPQIEGIIKYANECLIKIATTYSTKIIQFNSQVALTR